jgi:hypothetical protein
LQTGWKWNKRNADPLSKGVQALLWRKGRKNYRTVDWGRQIFPTTGYKESQGYLEKT